MFMISAMSRRVGFLVGPAFDLLDLSGPLEAFHVANVLAPDSYRLTVMSNGGGLVESAAGLPVMTEQATPDGLDTLLVISGRPAIVEAPGEQVEFVKKAGGTTRRVASVCVGAFVLAAAGLLDGKVATTHWNWAAKLQARHPGVRVDGDRIFTSDQGVWTSAGITAGIDLALALIAEDLGDDVARAVARFLVVYHRRAGGQLQHSSLLEFDPGSDRIRRALTFARENLGKLLTVEALAEIANLSVRQFGRAFAAAAGTTPAKAVERLRVEAARLRVEDGRETLEEIARSTGFVDAGRMRQSFIRIIGQTPQNLRRARHASGVKTERL